MTSGADTIYALASGAGRAGLAVIRVSGPRAGEALEGLTRETRSAPRRAVRKRLLCPLTRAPLDDAIVIWFPGPDSFTGEDVAELHVHGGPAVIAATLEALAAVPDTRLALPGEFTRRAFEHGKMDLTAAEAIADLVEAETEGQRKQALRQMEGGLAALYEGWRARLIEIAALLEAEIDFPDEDLPGGLAAKARPPLEALIAAIEAHLADAHRGERVRDGYRIAIIGAPNAGKSSLLNALAAREAAIVSNIPGTTRDVVEIRLTLGGFPVWIADTAGLRAARNAVEAEGVRRALERAGEADLRLGVVDAAAREIDAATRDALRPGDLLVLNKSDLNPRGAAAAAQAMAGRGGLTLMRASAKAGEGVPELLDALTGIVSAALAARETPPLTRARHRALLRETRQALARADQALGLGAELAAEDLRLAARSLGRVTGRVDVEHILDEIFSRFCIGK
jgi:tRNA modification GTPase